MRPRQLRRLLPDPRIPLVSYTTAMRKISPHVDGIKTIVGALYNANIRELNYDHVTLSIPKKPVPLWIERRRFDIAFVQGEDYIFIDVFAIPRDHLDLKEREGG